MSVFTFKLKDNFNVAATIDEKDQDYPLMCLEYDKIITKYIINQELHSEKLWKYLQEEFKILDETNVLQKTEINIDEKNKQHKLFKYYVKCEINRNMKFHLIFFDEYRNMADDDYSESVIEHLTADDKSDKVDKLVIYYDPETVPTKYLEDNVIPKILENSYTPSMKNQFFTIATSSYGGYEIRPSYIKKMNVDLELNYGKKFISVYDKTLYKLKNDKHGLFLFFGEPGTGKTVVIRKLISELSEEKTIIYVPSYMMQNIADPELISFISGFKNAILLLEDAEEILTKDMGHRSQAVANILNMTDGLLNDYMQLQIISTFNTDIAMVDPALRRAGRLVVSHKFTKLTKAQANKLSESIGSERRFEKPVTLAEIYEGTNQIINEDDLTTTKIGFKL